MDAPAPKLIAPVPGHSDSSPPPVERRRLVLAASLSLVWAALTLLAEFSGALEPLEEPLTDWRQTLTSLPSPAPEQLALVGIDAIPEDRPWPWSRLDYALVLRSLIDYGPQSVVFEMNLNERDPIYTAFDATFAHIVARADTVIFSATAMTSRSTEPLAPDAGTLAFSGSSGPLHRFGSLLWPLATFTGSSPVGLNNLQADAGLHLRDVPLVFLVHQSLLPSLALDAAAQYLGADLASSQVVLGRAIYLRRADSSLVRAIPIDEQGRLPLRFHPGAVASWSAGFDNVLVYDDQIQHHLTPGNDLHQLAHRQVWIGRTDPGQRERFLTPIGPLSRVEAQMATERAILNQDYLRPLPPLILALLFLAIGTLGAPLVVRLGLEPALALLLVALIFGWEAAIFAFRIDNIVLPLPGLAMLLLGTFACGILAAVWELEPESELGG